MAILSSKHFRLSFQHNKFLRKTSATQQKYPQEQQQLQISHIQKLPKELLDCIYQHLETIECQTAFSTTCKSFHKIASNTRSNAGWIVTRFGPRFALYYALLKYSTKCNSQFIHYLINFGAKVPRYLIQVLIQVYGKPIDSMTEQNMRRRRRSSFNTMDLDLYFLKSIQKLPFDGYATIMNEGLKAFGCNIGNNDLNQFLSALEEKNSAAYKDLLYQQYFFPAPIIPPSTTTSATTTNYRQILKLAQTSPKDYNLIAPIFDFDPFARGLIWESILSFFFDEAFKSSATVPTREKRAQFESIKSTIIVQKGKHTQLVGPLNDQQIFCQVFAAFFTKYPVGYCHQKAMKKLLCLLKTYVEPNFNIDLALEHMVQTNIGRSDTIESVDKYLKETSSS